MTCWPIVSRVLYGLVRKHRVAHHVIRRSVHAGKVAKAVKIVCSVAALGSLTAAHPTVQSAVVDGGAPSFSSLAAESRPYTRPDLPNLDPAISGFGVPIAELLAGLDHDGVQGLTLQNGNFTIGENVQNAHGPTSSDDPGGNILVDPAAHAAPVPEPSSIGVFGTALLAFLWQKIRRAHRRGRSS